MITVYTAITGGYDELQPVPPLTDMEGVRFVAHIDDVSKPAPGWAPFNIGGWELHGPGPRVEQRRIKIMFPALVLDVGEYAIYHDASMSLKMHPREIIADVLGANYDFALLKHPWRSNVSEEADEIERLNLCKPGAALDAAMAYRARGNKTGLWSGGFFALKVTPLTRAFLMQWWSMYQGDAERGCDRDQLSLSEAIRVSGVQPRTNTLLDHPWKSRYFSSRKHAKC